MGAEDVGGFAGPHLSRPMEHQRGAYAAVVDVRLHTAHVADVAHRVGAIIVEVQDDGVFAETKLVEFPEEAANVLVDVGDHGADARELVGLGLQPGRVGVLVNHDRSEIDLEVFLIQLLGHVVVRTVRGVGGDISKEILLPFSGRLDEIHRAVKIDVRTVPFHRGLDTVLDEGRVSVFALGPYGIGGLADATAAVNETVLKALIHWPHRIVVAQMPFAVDASAVVGSAQEFGNGHLGGIHHRPTNVGIDAPRAVVVASGHQAGAGRRAHGADVELGEQPAPLGHDVQLRRANDLVSHEAVITAALVVTHDDEYVRPLGLRGRRQSAQDKGSE